MINDELLDDYIIYSFPYLDTQHQNQFSPRCTITAAKSKENIKYLEPLNIFATLTINFPFSYYQNK